MLIAIDLTHHGNTLTAASLVDAIVLDTDGLSIQEVLEKIISRYRKIAPENGSQ
jgi:cytidylate kinase